jgi:hypothetical protein
MHKMVAVALAWLGFGCSVEEMAKPPVVAPVGQSEREVARTVFLELELQRSNGERVAGTHTQLDMFRPVRFSSRTADGGDIEVEIFAEPATSEDRTETFRVALEVTESDSTGKVVKWRPTFNLGAGKQGVATMNWGVDGRRLTLVLGEHAAPATKTAEVALAPPVSEPPSIAAAPARVDGAPDNALRAVSTSSQTPRSTPAP